MSDILRSSLIKLAHTNPELRPHLLPILKTAGSYAEYKKRKETANEKPMAEKAWASRTKHHKEMAQYHKSMAGASAGDVKDDHEHAQKAHESAAQDPDKKNPNNGISASHSADRASNRAMVTHHEEQASHLHHVGQHGDAVKHEDAAKAHRGVSRGESKGADGGKLVSDIEKDSKAAWKATGKTY